MLFLKLEPPSLHVTKIRVDLDRPLEPLPRPFDLALGPEQSGDGADLDDERVVGGFAKCVG